MDSYAELSGRKKRLELYLPRCAIAMLGLLVLTGAAWGTTVAWTSAALLIGILFVYARLLKAKRDLDRKARAARGREMQEELQKNGLMRREHEDVDVSASEWKKRGKAVPTWLEGQRPVLLAGDKVVRWKRDGTAGGSEGLAIEREGKIVAVCKLMHLSFGPRVH